MNIHLEKFVKKKFKSPGMAYDLGYGRGEDIEGMKNLGWVVIGFDKINGFNLNYGLVPKGDADLVCSNFCIQFIKNKKQFINNCYGLLKPDGLLFLQTMDISDGIMGEQTMSKSELFGLLIEKFSNIQIEKFEEYDSEHDHTHVILKATARKRDDDEQIDLSPVAYNE